MKYKYLAGILFFFACLFFYLFYLVHIEAREKAITELNSRQTIHAKQAQQGIENFFDNLTSSLSKISGSPNIINLDGQGKSMIDQFIITFSNSVTALTRVDEFGKISYTSPYKKEVIGRDISYQKHVQEIMTTHKAVVSDVFAAVQGYPAIALHVPVFEGNDFRGTLGVLIDFRAISKQFLEVIKLGETGYAWMISGEGIELYCPVPGHTGKSVYDTSKNFPTIIAMADNMIKGRQGVTTYFFDQIRDQQTKSIKKHAVYLPIKIVDKFWSIVVVSSEKEVLSSLVNFRNKIVVLVLLFLVLSGLFSYFGLRSWLIVQESKKLRKSQKALKESELFLNSIIENIPNMIFVKDAKQLKFVRFNRAGEELLGYTRDELFGKNDYDFFPKEEALFFIEKDREVLENKKLVDIPYEQVQTKEEGIRFLHTKKMPIIDADGSPKYLLGISEDITDQIKAEAELHESHDRFRTLFENAPLCYQSLDESGCFLEVNETWLTQLGYTKDEVIGKSFGDFLPGESKDHFKDNFPRFKAIGEILGVEFEMLKKDGSTVLMSINGKIGRNLDGSFKQTHCVLQDITEHRKLEEQLRQSHKMEAVGTMAGGIAHDFNNILTIISGNAELAIDDIPAGNPARESIEEICQASGRAKDLVSQILAFSRKETKELIPIHPQTLIKETLKLLRSTTPTTVTIIQSISQDCGRINADPTSLHQVLMNLFTNAVHAMGEKGEVTVSLQEVNLDSSDFEQLTATTQFFSIKTPGAYARLSVTDKGTGMDEDTVARIFDPFYTTKEVGKGTGMGLSVVHGIVKSHEGFIDVDSEPGQGSSFHVYFPITEEEEEESFKAEIISPQTGKERILFIDDEEALLVLGKRILDKLGYEVTAENSSVKALKIFKSAPHKFDLIITDQAMPDMSGLELIAEIVKVRPDIPVILCTGFSSKVSEENAKEKGISKFINKPYTKKILAGTVREVLGAKV